MKSYPAQTRQRIFYLRYGQLLGVAGWIRSKLEHPHGILMFSNESKKLLKQAILSIKADAELQKIQYREDIKGLKRLGLKGKK